MNSGFESNHPSIEYYDSDYPSEYFGDTDNFDGTTELQGLSHDVKRYLELAKQHPGVVLELCCGTGRVAIPLARNGSSVLGVDISKGLLEKLDARLNKEEESVQQRLSWLEQDATGLQLGERKFDLIICAFNSLLCITDFALQVDFLKGVQAHLSDDGVFALDIVNPLELNHKGCSQPKVFFTRKNEATGNQYSRISMAGAFDEQQRQEIYGWYDEIEANGAIRRSYYSMFWRPIFRFELELMLKSVGLKILKIEGGHCGEVYRASSPRMFLQIGKI